MNPTRQLLLGFITSALAVMAGWWFAHNYYRIGPEWLEPVVLVGFAALLLAGAAFGFLQLVKGIKRLE